MQTNVQPHRWNLSTLIWMVQSHQLRKTDSDMPSISSMISQVQHSSTSWSENQMQWVLSTKFCRILPRMGRLHESDLTMVGNMWQILTKLLWRSTSNITLQLHMHHIKMVPLREIGEPCSKWLEQWSSNPRSPNIFGRTQWWRQHTSETVFTISELRTHPIIC